MSGTSKRARISEDSSLIGKIVSVSVKDFVTYDSVTFYPGEYLNIIIGPNGTGKSTLVAAIVIGMGGNAKLLSRSTNLHDYIKNGKNSAEVHIGLYRNGLRANTVFSRFIQGNGKSSWQIDGQTVTQTDYLAKVASYNIQIGNLCQFLPQDRVQDFTKMNPQELLDNTQLSVCQPDVTESFNTLKELREEQKSKGETTEKTLAAVRENEKRNESLQVEIDKLKTRNEINKKLDVLLIKKSWMEFENLFIKYKETEDDLKKAKDNEKQCEAEMLPLVERSKEIKKTTAEFESKIKKEFDAYQTNKAGIEKIDEQIRVLETTLAKSKAEYSNAKTTIVEQKQELNKAVQLQQAFLQDLKNAAAECGSEKERDSKVATIDGKIQVLKSKINEIVEQRHNISRRLEDDLNPRFVAANQKIATMENVADRKMELLRSRYDHVYRAVLWLRQNQHLLTGKVYEPMILELNISDNQYAKYFENFIAIRDLISFTCEESEDLDLIFRKVRQEQKLNVNVIHSAKVSSIQYKPHIPIGHLKRFGFSTYMLDLIEGPLPILNYLCRMYNIHSVPIGNDRAYEMSENVPNEIRLFFTTNHRFSITVSKYSGEKSSMCIEIKGRGLLSIGVDTKKMDEQKSILNDIIRKKDQCKNQCTVLEDQIRNVEEKCRDLKNERLAILAKFITLDGLKDKLKRHNFKINKLRETMIDLDKEKAKFKLVSMKIIDKMVEQIKQQAIFYKKYADSQNNYQKHKEHFQMYKKCNIELHNEIQEIQESIDRAKKYVRKITEALDRYKIKCKEKQEFASRLSDGKKPTDRNFPYKHEFNEWKSLTMEELQGIADDLQGRIDCIRIENENVLQEFDKRKREIDRLMSIIQNSNDERNRLEEKITKLHDKWYTSVLSVIDVINTNFSKFMSSMGYAGEVELVRKAERDYSDYGIEIRVKYRNNEKLQALDRFVQSGGERAVAIAIYTLSLQHISHVPFRCVDEINQGMDPRNERKVFEMLIGHVAQQGKPQFFFVTPKLLPNLPYNDLVSFHIVHNGKFNDDPLCFDRVRCVS